MSTSVSRAVTMMIGTLRPDAQLAAHLGARQPRQHQVEQHEVGADALERGQRLGSGRGDLDLVALASQHVRQRIRERLLVLDDQHSGHALPSLAGAGSAPASLRRSESDADLSE